MTEIKIPLSNPKKEGATWLVFKDSHLPEYYEVELDGEKMSFEVPVALGTVNKNDMKRLGRAS